MGVPLLSRFDLILVLRDEAESNWDLSVSTHILTSLGAPPKTPESDSSVSAVAAGAVSSADAPSTATACLEEQKDLWSTEKLRFYFTHIRNLKPDLSHEAAWYGCCSHASHLRIITLFSFSHYAHSRLLNFA